MTYNIETIPAKIYFKILETGDTTLLTDNKEVDTVELWNNIVDQTEEYHKNSKSEKILFLSKKIQQFSTQLDAIKNAVYYLKHEKDEGLINMLLEYGYNVKPTTLKKDIEKIQRESNAIQIKIDKYAKELEKFTPKDKQAKSTFEDLYMSYLAILGLGYQNSNSITFLDFKGIEKQVLSKIKALDGRKR